MGIEKVLPRFRDLEVFPQLLPRSSTGERMNPYTSMWTGVTPGDGPQEFHLVLLDNGRTKALADEVGRQALHCIRCSACLNVCPVYERTGGHAYGSVYPGPIGAILTPLLRGTGTGPGSLDPHDPTASLPYASSLCGACFEACPVKIDIPAVLVHLRNRVTEAQQRRPLPTGWEAAMGAASAVMSSGRRFGAAAATARAGRLLARDERIGRLPFPASLWTEQPGPARPAARDASGPGGPGTRARRRTAGTMTDAREAVLARIRDALGRTPDAARPTVPRGYRTRSDVAPGSPEALDLLVDRLEDYRPGCTGARRPTCPPPWPTCSPTPGPSSSRPALPEGWLAALPAGVAVHTDAPGARLSNADLDGAGAVLTGARVAIAETGTIVLDGEPDQGRRAITLVPDRHVCVVDRRAGRGDRARGGGRARRAPHPAR